MNNVFLTKNSKVIFVRPPYKFLSNYDAFFLAFLKFLPLSKGNASFGRARNSQTPVRLGLKGPVGMHTVLEWGLKDL